MNEFFEAVFTLRDALMGVLGFLGGAFCGHRFSLLRDRRRERNAASESVRAWLLDQIERPSCYVRALDAVDLDRLEHCLPRRQRRAFREAWAAAKAEAHHQQQRRPTGDAFYADEAAVSAAYRRVLPFTQRV